jgi:hypothetical protein
MRFCPQLSFIYLLFLQLPQGTPVPPMVGGGGGGMEQQQTQMQSQFGQPAAYAQQPTWGQPQTAAQPAQYGATPAASGDNAWAQYYAQQQQQQQQQQPAYGQQPTYQQQPAQQQPAQQQAGERDGTPAHIRLIVQVVSQITVNSGSSITALWACTNRRR